MRKLIFCCRAFVCEAGSRSSSGFEFRYLAEWSLYIQLCDRQYSRINPVDEFDIVVARPPNQPDLTPVPPSSFTSPAGWSFHIAVGGTDPVSCGLWEWQALNTPALYSRAHHFPAFHSQLT